MAKYSGKPAKKTGTPLFVWVIVAVGVLAILGVGSFFGYRILRGPTGTEALPAAHDMPSLPRPDLPEGPALPESAEMPPLPGGPALPQVEPSQRPQLPEGPALPEAEPAPPPEPEPAGPSGIVYWAATVHPYTPRVRAGQRGPGFRYVTAYFRILNKSTGYIHIDHGQTSLEYQGQSYSEDAFASGFDAFSNRSLLSAIDLPPNTFTEGYVGFQIPQGSGIVIPKLKPKLRPSVSSNALLPLPREIQVRRVTPEQLSALQASGP